MSINRCHQPRWSDRMRLRRFGGSTSAMVKQPLVAAQSRGVAPEGGHRCCSGSSGEPEKVLWLTVIRNTVGPATLAPGILRFPLRTRTH